MDPITITALSVIGLLLLSIPVMLILGWLRQRERRRQLRTFASAHGFSYTTLTRLPAELARLPYFRGTVQLWFRRRVKNLLRRTHAGLEIMVFDYWFVDSTLSLPTSRTTRATVVCVRRGAGTTWRAFPLDGLDYVEVALLDRFIHECVHTFRIAPPAAEPPAS